MYKITVAIIALFFLVACTAQNEPVDPVEPIEITRIVENKIEIEVTRLIEVIKNVEVTVEVPIEVEVTRIVEKVITVTFTPTPVHTSTSTSTPTITPTPTITSTPTRTPTSTPTVTPTPTATPFKLSQCVDFKLTRFPGLPGKVDAEELKAYDGKCIHSYYEKSLGTIYLVPVDHLNHGNIGVTFKKDAETPEDVSAILSTTYGEVWGIFDQNQNAGLMELDGNILLRNITEFEVNKSPKIEGLFAVGAGLDMAPGMWKSGMLPTDSDNCYWARLNPNNGSIRDNHFGIGGMTIRVYEGDIFETNGNCSPWFYVGP